MKAKKAQLNNLFQSVLMLVMIVIVVGLGVIVLSNMASQQTALNTSNSLYAANVLNNGSAAIGSISTTWVSIIVIIIIVGLIIGILLASFAFKKQR